VRQPTLAGPNPLTCVLCHCAHSCAALDTWPPVDIRIASVHVRAARRVGWCEEGGEVVREVRWCVWAGEVRLA
jgi:hypothetical protein